MIGKITYVVPANWREILLYLVVSAALTWLAHYINGTPIVLGVLPLPGSGRGESGTQPPTG